MKKVIKLVQYCTLGVLLLALFICATKIPEKAKDIKKQEVVTTKMVYSDNIESIRKLVETYTSLGYRVKNIESQMILPKFTYGYTDYIQSANIIVIFEKTELK